MRLHRGLVLAYRPQSAKTPANSATATQTATAPSRAPSILRACSPPVQTPWASRSSSIVRNSVALLSRIHGPISSAAQTIWAPDATLPFFGAHVLERPRRPASDHCGAQCWQADPAPWRQCGRYFLTRATAPRMLLSRCPCFLLVRVRVCMRSVIVINDVKE